MPPVEKRIVEFSSQDRHILEKIAKGLDNLKPKPSRPLSDEGSAKRRALFEQFFGQPLPDFPDIFPGHHPDSGNQVFPYKSGDVLVLGPELFLDDEKIVMSYKGQEYLKTCGEFVRDLPDGGQAFCVKWAGHPRPNEHEDKTGHISTGFAG